MEFPASLSTHLALSPARENQTARAGLRLRLRLGVLGLAARLPRKELIIAEQVIRVVERPLPNDRCLGARFSDIPRTVGVGQRLSAFIGVEANPHALVDGARHETSLREQGTGHAIGTDAHLVTIDLDGKNFQVVDVIQVLPDQGLCDARVGSLDKDVSCQFAVVDLASNIRRWLPWIGGP